ncbi:hypothetical protein ACJX0J_017893 [Zea mays]
MCSTMLHTPLTTSLKEWKKKHLDIEYNIAQDNEYLFSRDDMVTLAERQLFSSLVPSLDMFGPQNRCCLYNNTSYYYIIYDIGLFIHFWSTLIRIYEGFTLRPHQFLG